MPLCDHCGKEGERKSVEYDLCLCKDCWERFKRRQKMESDGFSQLTSQQEYWERQVLPYQYSAPVSINPKKKGV